MQQWVSNWSNIWLRKFFRSRLLTLSNDEIAGYIEQLDKEVRAYKDEALRMCWFMRGGLSYDESMMLSKAERDLISDIIKDNIETTKKSKMPFF